jgi:hypothetical protein
MAGRTRSTLTVEIARDRDDQGRPRNSRPRDGLGRPLPRWVEGVTRVPDELDLSIPEAIEVAQEFLSAARPFHAHEVLEWVWKSGPDDERDLWQGLAQLCVGLTHGLRGNTVGAVTLLRRGTARLGAYSGESHGVQVARIIVYADTLAHHIDAHGVAELRVADFVLRLT